MSFEVIDFDEVDLSLDEASLPRPPRPATWAVVGLVLGIFIGFLSAADFESVASGDSTLPPLTLPSRAAGPTETQLDSTQPRVVIPGFSQTLWLLVDPQNPRLLRWSPHEPAPSPDVRPITTLSVRPDASGAAYAEEIPLASGALLMVTRAPSDYTDNYTMPLSLSVTGWAWHESIARRIAWSEPDADGTVIKWTSFGPTTGELRVEGTWRVAAYGERIVAASSQSVLLIDPDGKEFLVERTVETAPLTIQGIFDGVVYGVHGDADTMVAIELALGNQDRVDWRHPNAISMAEAPLTGWGVLWFGRSVEIHGPQGTVYTHKASGQPHWSEDGQYLMFPDLDDVVVFSILSRRFGTLPTPGRVVEVWGS